ncbi:hypothetical protein FIBSPDRAFT_976089, partial [Athelia psychrophila]
TLTRKNPSAKQIVGFRSASNTQKKGKQLAYIIKKGYSTDVCVQTIQPLSLQTTLREIPADMMMIVVMQELNSAISLSLQIWRRYMSQEQLEIELIVIDDERTGFVVAVDSWDKHLGPGRVHIGEGGGGGVMGLGVESMRDLNQYLKSKLILGPPKATLEV